MTHIQIRETSKADYDNIMLVENAAFNNDESIQTLVTDLLVDESGSPMLSLLAFIGDKAVGHVIFTRAYVNDRDDNQALLHILAPLAVVPEFQKQGIGAALIKEGFTRLKEMGCAIVFVLGHIDYYPKYGFINDGKSFGFEAPHHIPEEVKDAWMIHYLNENSKVKKGKVLCCKLMDKEHYWRE